MCVNVVKVEPINRRSGFRTTCTVVDENGDEHVGEELGVNKKESKRLATINVRKLDRKRLGPLF